MDAAISLVLLLVQAVPALQSQGPVTPRQGTKERVASLTRQLDWRRAATSEEERSVWNGITDRIHEEINAYIRVLDAHLVKDEDLQDQLRDILAPHASYDPELIGPPLARIADGPKGRALVITYVLMRGLHDSTVTVRGYRSVDGRFQPVASTGSDFDRFGLFAANLPAPLPGEIWILAHGRAITFNGTLIRVRAYAFDGERFRTLWGPEDMLNANVRMTANGFTIVRANEQPQKLPYRLQDEYVLTLDGPIRVSSRSSAH